MRGYVVLLISCLALGGCQTNQTYSGIDGHKPTPTEVKQARLICEPRADAAAQAATASSPPAYGVGNAIGTGIAQGIVQANVRNNTLTSCLAERGLIADASH